MRSRLSLLVLVVCACTPSVRNAPAPAGYDLLITNARVVDGAGNPWYRGSVATRGDRIAYVGPSLPGMTAKHVIDAHEQVVSPGFIDMLGHSEFALLRQPTALSKVTQGIASEITGEVESAWPNTEPTARETRTAAQPWTSLGGYFTELERKGTAINLGTYVTAGSVRRAAKNCFSASAVRPVWSM